MAINDVTAIRSDSNPFVAGPVTLASGTNVTLSQSGQVITVSASGGGTVPTLDQVAHAGSLTDLALTFPQLNFGTTTASTGMSLSADANFNIFLGDNTASAASGNSIFMGNYAGNGTTGGYNANFFGNSAGLNATSAYFSNFFGASAGAGATGAESSNFFGTDAGYNASSAQNSNFFGNTAGSGATSAENSNFFGNLAGYNASGASGSNFFGVSAGAGALGAANSNFFGSQTGNGATYASFSNFFGDSAGFGATNATQSNFYGFNAGYGATGAHDSFFGGTNAGYNATGSYESVFIGPNAGQAVSSTTSHASVFIGKQAGEEADDSYQSNFIGNEAGHYATSSYYANFFGLLAGYGATNAQRSNFLGTSSGYQATGAYSSNFLGDSAGYGAYGAYVSNFLGEQAGYQAYGAYQSNFLGANAGYSDGSSGISNNSHDSNFFGTNAGTNADGANYSNFIGFAAGYSNAGVSGTLNNTQYSNFIGQAAGYQADGSSSANFIGQQAGYSSGSNYANYGVNNGAYYSNFIGYQAGYDADQAAFSNFIGYQAGQNALAGNFGATYANFIGFQAGYQADAASYSNFMGYGAGYQATSASECVFIGNFAGGFDNNAVASVFLGSSAGESASNASYTVGLGQSAGQAASNASNAAFIGNSAGMNATNAYNSLMAGAFAGNGSTYMANSVILGYQSGYQDYYDYTGDDNGPIIVGYNSQMNGNSNSAIFGSNTNATSSNQMYFADYLTSWNIAGVPYLMPSSNATGVLTNDGSGNLTWAASAGGVTSVNGATGAVTLTVANTGGTLAYDVTTPTQLNIPTATSGINGLLNHLDWVTFNNKLSNITGLVTAGSNITITGSGTAGSPYSISASSSGVTGSGTQYQVTTWAGTSSLTGSSGFTYDANNTLNVTGASLSGSASSGILNLSQTWNTSGSPTAIKLNVTNTASGSASKFLDFQYGGSSIFRIGRYGDVNIDVSAAPSSVTGLYIKQSSNGSSALTVYNDGGANNNYTFISTGNAGFSTYFRQSGQIGIGQASPVSQIAVGTGLQSSTASSVWGVEGIGIDWKALTYTDSNNAGGTVTQVNLHSLGAPTFTNPNSAITYTNAATVYIAGAPIAAGSVTITNPYSLQVASGLSRFTGSSLSGSQAVGILTLDQTWNTSGAPTAFSVAVTNTASSSSSKLFDFKNGSTSMFSMTIGGNMTAGSGSLGGYLLTVNGSGGTPSVLSLGNGQWDTVVYGTSAKFFNIITSNTSAMTYSGGLRYNGNTTLGGGMTVVDTSGTPFSFSATVNSSATTGRLYNYGHQSQSYPFSSPNNTVLASSYWYTAGNGSVWNSAETNRFGSILLDNTYSSTNLTKSGFVWYTTVGATLAEAMRLDGNNLGLGVTSTTAKLDIADATLSGSGSLAGSVLNLAQTWNTSGNPTAFKLTVTNTASSSSSLLMDMRVGSTSAMNLAASSGALTLNELNGGNAGILKINGYGGSSGNYAIVISGKQGGVSVGSGAQAAFSAVNISASGNGSGLNVNNNSSGSLIEAVNSANGDYTVANFAISGSTNGAVSSPVNIFTLKQTAGYYLNNGGLGISFTLRGYTGSGNPVATQAGRISTIWQANNTAIPYSSISFENINSAGTFGEQMRLAGDSLLIGATATVSNSRLLVKDGHTTSLQTTAPTVAASSNAGTGATASLSNATDTAGNITLTSGTVSFASGTQLTVTFNKAYAVAPIVVMTPTGANAGGLYAANQPYVTSTTTGFTISFGVALAAISTAYTWSYHVIETQ